MRPILALALIGLTTTGCATGSGVELPTGEAAALIHDWMAVQRLERTTHVLVELDPDGILDGEVYWVTADYLELDVETGRVHVDRASVARVVTIKNNAKTGAKQGAVIGLIIGGVVFVTSGGAFWPPLLFDPPLLAGLGAAGGALAHRQVLVYERR
jgi:hypothetical protein